MSEPDAVKRAAQDAARFDAAEGGTRAGSFMLNSMLFALRTKKDHFDCGTLVPRADDRHNILGVECPVHGFIEAPKDMRLEDRP